MNNIAFPQNCSDRFIPLRKQLDWQVKMNLYEDEISCEPPKISNQTIEKQVLFKSLLKNELIGTKIYDLKVNNCSCDVLSNSSPNLFTYSPSSLLKTPPHVTNSIYTTSSQNLFKYSSISDRYNISVHPYKVLDAPELIDDFYLNLIDWSCKNQICTALRSSVYIWCGDTEEVLYLCDVDPAVITSVAFNESGTTLAFGTDRGLIQVWDIETRCKIKELKSFSNASRTFAIVWNENMVISGGSGKTIVKHDIKNHNQYPVQKLVGHVENVCGLKLSNTKQYLASGGNDNLVCVWDERSTSNIHRFTSHTSAVKALAWSSQQNNILCTGGGAHDRTIRVWNIQSGKQLHEINTGSQVCNLTWSKYSNDFLSTHGSRGNDILVWNYPRLNCVAKLNGHSTRVLYLASSPCGKNVATAGGEELRLWKVFDKCVSNKAKKSSLELFGNIR